MRQGTAKLLTLFHPVDGRVRVQGVTACPNAVLHPWLKSELSAILVDLPPAAPVVDPLTTAAAWRRWQEELSVRFTLPNVLPPLRMLLVLDNLAAPKGLPKTPDFVLWLVAQGIIPLYTPLGGSWLNMAESIQRILVRRALAGQSPETPEQIMHDLKAAALHWNQAPTPFVWGGKRAARRTRARQRRHARGGSGAYTRRPISRHPAKLHQWLYSDQMTH